MLELKNIYKTFNPGTINEKVALNGLNLTLNEGDFVTVIGGNGAGKSTMLNAVAGTWQVDEGQIIIDGIDGEHHDFARVNVRAEYVVHMEILEIVETPRLAGNEQHRLAAVAVDLELHFSVQVVGIAFKITNFHGMMLLIDSTLKSTKSFSELR